MIEIRHYLSCNALQLFCKINISAINIYITGFIATRFLNLFSHGYLTRFASIVITVNDLITSMTEMSELRFLHHFSIIKYSISKKNVHCTKKGLSTVSNRKGQPLPLQSIRTFTFLL